jgi:hypothetical protein
MNKVDTICPWCFEIQDTGMIRKMTRANEYMQLDEAAAAVTAGPAFNPDKWDEVVSGDSETCKNCGKEFVWRFKTIIVAEATRIQWAVPMSATAMTPKVVGLMPTKHTEDDDAES